MFCLRIGRNQLARLRNTKIELHFQFIKFNFSSLSGECTLLKIGSVSGVKMKYEKKKNKNKAMKRLCMKLGKMLIFALLIFRLRRFTCVCVPVATGFALPSIQFNQINIRR